MDHTHILLIAVAVAVAAALGLAVVLRWIFTPRRRAQGPAPRAAGASGAWDGAARRRRDLAT